MYTSLDLPRMEPVLARDPEERIMDRPWLDPASDGEEGVRATLPPAWESAELALDLPVPCRRLRFPSGEAAAEAERLPSTFSPMP
mmetsp:Transcript_61978/g.139542  ORF Transcript_61978/g.139542 Transcript_61978/m.139542 type:complete len:85 (-) Transcript_61978:139-393(-)